MQCDDRLCALRVRLAIGGVVGPPRLAAASGQRQIGDQNLRSPTRSRCSLTHSHARTKDTGGRHQNQVNLTASGGCWSVLCVSRVPGAHPFPPPSSAEQRSSGLSSSPP